MSKLIDSEPLIKWIVKEMDESSISENGNIRQTTLSNVMSHILSMQSASPNMSVGTFVCECLEPIPMETRIGTHNCRVCEKPIK